MPPAIEVTNVTKTYKPRIKGAQEVEALKGVSLTVPAGEFFALLGPNGAGKTSLIGILTGIVQKSGGEVRINGISIDEDPDTAKTFIGVVPQEMNFNFFEKVEDIILGQAGYYGIPRSEAKPKVEQLLKDLGLYDKRKERSQSLSGGMKRRLMIARALVHQPKILLLDEPTAGVDVELRRGMWDYLRRINGEGTTIVLTTHYLEEAEQLSRHVAIINKGAVVTDEPTKELIDRHEGQKLEDIFLKLIEEEKPAV
ncbi:MAG TPA: ABC transporter ATP-binding protein [Candidatus Paceibacterota bacterium]|nr:ABC transporter ATP-binding protein [Candidatus Paceibacterota bacterium]